MNAATIFVLIWAIGCVAIAVRYRRHRRTLAAASRRLEREREDREWRGRR
jgi:hypothetical protein